MVEANKKLTRVGHSDGVNSDRLYLRDDPTTETTIEEYKARREAWAVALESGQYVQGRTCLKQVDRQNNVRWCCLGVAEDLRGVDWLEGLYRDFKLADTGSQLGIYRSGGMTQEGKDYYGLRDISGGYDMSTLVYDNDTSEVNFAEIAVKIRTEMSLYRDGTY